MKYFGYSPLRTIVQNNNVFVRRSSEGSFPNGHRPDSPSRVTKSGLARSAQNAARSVEHNMLVCVVDVSHQLKVRKLPS